MGLPGEPNNVPNSSQSKRGGSGSGPSDYEVLDSEIATKIRILEKAKDQSVANEHFDEAKQIKEGLDRTTQTSCIQSLDRRYYLENSWTNKLDESHSEPIWQSANEPV